MREPTKVPAATERVRFDRQNTPRGVVLRPSGELDFANVSVLWTNLETIVEDHQNVVLDLSRLSYMDSGGLKVLLDAHRLFLQKNHGFALADPSPIVSRILEVVGLDKHFYIFDSVEAALESFS